MKILAFATILLCLSSCKKQDNLLELTTYRASLKIQDNQEIPFQFKVKSNNLIEIYNADEVIIVDEITYKNDSIYIQTPVFEGYIVAKISDDKSLKGYFVKPSLNRSVLFNATTKNTSRFKTTKKPLYNITGNWQTIFSPNKKEDRYIAKGIFSQNKNKVVGTFRTTTGDYRYLEGIVNGDSLKLSTFDGAHAFLFTAKVTDSTLTGVFYSGNHWKESFTAKLNTNYELPSENTLTTLNKGYNSFNFSFPDESGKLVSYSDELFKNKVTLVQIMGTWCPNCLDETMYYVDYLKKNSNTAIQFVALAFEIDKTPEKAFEKINRLKTRLKITYPILLAQYKGVNKKEAAEKLPMLNHILSYPTTVFIDKKGKVRKIHTGFNGPATGQKYIDFKNEFKSFIDTLVKE
ncbi:TlpA disulfide reductase family protein [Tenacibaculum sp. HL-MS23]|uniref:peroxiredoxin family protein n=1 Tax=Tenacibaculum sp. HL-MS23 TaxID=3077734 RepID=UPI0028FC0A8D|nr:TlpA disulfide reductase family protein [Tenacibaculum sp. HL-MS23]WNW02546.1 TlpA disulfide reductase family protein [Tenacibaculum sp. HL-MS23]